MEILVIMVGIIVIAIAAPLIAQALHNRKTKVMLAAEGNIIKGAWSGTTVQQIDEQPSELFKYNMQYRAGIITYDEYYIILKQLEKDGLITVDVDIMFDRMMDAELRMEKKPKDIKIQELLDSTTGFNSGTFHQLILAYKDNPDSKFWGSFHGPRRCSS